VRLFFGATYQIDYPSEGIFSSSLYNMNPTITEHFLRQLNELANILFVLMVMSSKLQKSFIDTESEIPSPKSSARQLKKKSVPYI